MADLFILYSGINLILAIVSQTLGFSVQKQ